MAWSAVSSAVTTIGQLLTQEAIYLWGVKKQVDRLQKELRWMQSFLIDLDARQGESERVRLWVAEIRDIAYDAEDVVETFALKIGSKRKGGFPNVVKRSACILKEGWMLHKTRSKTEEIMASISELTRQLQTYGIKESRNGEESTSSYERRELRRSYPHIIEDNIVGLDDETKRLVLVLVDEESHSRVVSICGMGGLGKTTLAKKVYRHSQIKSHFHHLAWVYVSQQCQRRNVWEGILSSFKILDDKDRKKQDQELAEEIFNYLKDKKCLVVLDDIWNVDAWDSLKAAFPTRETSSKILLTSRNKEVASHADTRGYLHELQCLKDEDSWELFQRIAFPERDSHSPDYNVNFRKEELGKAMVKQCAGLPLAIVVLGGILATKSSLSEWQMVSENVKSYLKRGKGQGTEHVLALSYDDLPPYLRPCFLYLSHFPEDYEICVETLIQLWVAEGIVSSKQDEGNGGEFMEDVAESYLIELAERCIIQVGKRDATFKIQTCRMHDLMRDLCLSKAKQENFLSIIDHSNSYQITRNDSPSVAPKVRRIVANEGTNVQNIKCFHLRSILFFSESSFLRPMMFADFCQALGEAPNINILVFVLTLICVLFMMDGPWRYIFNNFKLLRVLHFEARAGGLKLPGAIGNLIHLRFLSLRGHEFIWRKLPSSLGNLRCLQTLDLRVEEIRFLPNVIWKLEQLRHLYLPKEWNLKTKLKLHTLKKLQTLVNFNARNCFVGDLSNMVSLTKLEIFGPFDIENFKEDLDKKLPIIRSKRIWYLSIQSHEGIDPLNVAFLLSSCSTICELVLSAEIGKLPEYHHFSSNIAYILLCDCKLEEDPMPTLEKLPNLRILKLKSNAFIGKKMVCSAECFPKLDSLGLYRLENLEEWTVDAGAMPTLRHLEIAFCSELKMLPDGLRFITTLRYLKIEGMPMAFKDKLVEGGEDFYKVQHVPSIRF